MGHAISSARGIAPLVDLAGLGGFFVAATLLKVATLVAGLGVDPKAIPMDDPRVYAVEYLTPLIVLPGLTWLLVRRGESWVDLGLRRPGSWARFAAWTLGTTGLALILNRILRWLPSVWGESWPASPFEALAGNRAALVVVAVYAVFLVGLTEELVFRGFAMSRVARLFGDSHGAWIAAALLTGLAFGALHFQHGLVSALNAAVLGLLFGLVYLGAGRNLWVVVVAHSLYDTVKAVGYFVG